MKKIKKTEKECLKCLESKSIKKDFYMSNSENHGDKRFPICKDCLRDNLNITKDTDLLGKDFLEVLQNTLLEMNRPFMYPIWVSSVEESQKTNKDLFGLYIKNIVFNFKGLTWKDSEFADSGNKETMSKIKDESVESVQKQNDDEEIEIIELGNKNKEDVLRMLGYDPFESEPLEDRRHLYNKLVDFLDESTLEDSFKLPAVIEIVKSFNQLDKINMALSKAVSDQDTLSKNAGGITSLINSKQKMLKAILDLAQENGISVKHSTNKSKGAGTLTGIIKQLQERGFEEASVNLYDIETSKGIKQVADLSNKSIVEQLQFDENDYTEMIIEQRELIEELDSKVMALEEENRLLKKELLNLNDQMTVTE